MECISVINGRDLTVCTTRWLFLVNTSRCVWTVRLQDITIIGKFSPGQLSRKLKRALSIVIKCTW